MLHCQNTDAESQRPLISQAPSVPQHSYLPSGPHLFICSGLFSYLVEYDVLGEVVH